MAKRKPAAKKAAPKSRAQKKVADTSSPAAKTATLDPATKAAAAVASEATAAVVNAAIASVKSPPVAVATACSCPPCETAEKPKKRGRKKASIGAANNVNRNYSLPEDKPEEEGSMGTIALVGLGLLGALFFRR